MTAKTGYHKEITFKLHKLNFLLNRLADQALTSKTDLTLSQFFMLKAIEQAPQSSQCTVARFLDLTEAAISRQVDLLIDKKLLERTPNPASRREHLLGIAKPGQKELARAKKVLTQAFSEFYGALDAKELEAFDWSLDKFIVQAKQQCIKEETKGEKHDNRTKR